PSVEDMPQSPVEPPPPVDVESMTPASEPVFDMDQLANAPQEPVSEPEPEQELPPMPEPGDAFTGREEVEFSMESVESTPVPAAPSIPMQESIPYVPDDPFAPPAEPEAAPPPPPQSAGFIPAPDEPFGDVFGEPPAPPAWVPTAAASE